MRRPGAGWLLLLFLSPATYQGGYMKFEVEVLMTDVVQVEAEDEDEVCQILEERGLAATHIERIAALAVDRKPICYDCLSEEVAVKVTDEFGFDYWFCTKDWIAKEEFRTRLTKMFEDAMANPAVFQTKLPKKVCIQLWLKARINNFAYWLVCHGHNKAAILLYKITGQWR
jgi:hypothetical protein